MFFIGSLEAAAQEAFYGKARDVSTSVCLQCVVELDTDFSF